MSLNVPLTSDDRILLHHLAIPLRDDFHTATGHVGVRDVGLIELTGHGATGWGEASPYPGQDETMEALLVEAKAGALTPTLHAGLTLAEADRSARLRGAALRDDIGATLASVPVSLAIGLGGDPVAKVRAAMVRGVSRFKIKIGPGNVDHVALIRAASPSSVLGVDANGSFDSDTVEEFGGLADIGIAYIEEPCDVFDDAMLARIRQVVDAPVFADESIRSVGDAEMVLRSPLVSGVVVKPGRLGFAGALDVIGIAERLGRRWRASGLLETGIGRVYTDLLAAIPTAFVSDVAPADWFFDQDVAPSRFSDAAMVIPDGPGLGVVPDDDVIERYLVATHEVSIT